MALSRTFRRRSRRARGVARVLHLFLPSRVSFHNRPAVTFVSTVRAVSGVSPRVCMFSLALGDARRGCGTVCGQPRVAAGFFLLSLWLSRRTHCVIERNRTEERSYTRYLYRLLTLKVIHGCPRPTVPAGRRVIAANPLWSAPYDLGYFCRHRNAKKLVYLRGKSNPSKPAAAMN